MRACPFSRKALPLMFCATLGVHALAFAQSTLLVNFGSDASSTTFGLSGWKGLLLSANMAYSTEGPGGVRVVSDPGETTEYCGVQGTPRAFTRGERIVATWYNTSDDTIIFTSRISFTDADQPDGGTSTGDWYTMRRFADYRYGFSRIAPRSTVRTAFNIESGGVHKSDGTHGVVNLGLSIEWGDNNAKLALVCDKIELMNDADITPPAAPTGLTATAVSDSKISLSWNAPSDNTGVVEYLVYLNGQVEGYSRETAFTAGLLPPSTPYSFTVSALDHCRNESPRSGPVIATTGSFAGSVSLIHPSGIRYLGAFRLPDAVRWGGEMLGYHPDGDGGSTGPGAADGHPGSLFTSNINTPEQGFVGEFSIPSPVRSASPGGLNEAGTLQAPVDIRPANVTAWPYVDIWQGDLCPVASAGSVPDALYSTWGYYYQVGGDKTASLSRCAAENLAAGPYNGAWNIGPAGGAPIDAALNDYLFLLPEDWANANTAGRRLVTGRNREGGLSGLGPTLYAVAPVDPGNPPSPGTELPLTTLLHYGPVERSDNYRFPDAFVNYNHADWFRGAEWLSRDSQRAVALVGNKGRGDNWYGYTGERMLHEWVIADVPYPEFAASDPDGKGWRAHNKIPIIVLYDPDDLAAVAAGTLASHEPQPYAALRLDTAVFFGPSRTIRESAFDAARGFLYVEEFVPEEDGLVVIHVWKVGPGSTGLEQPNGRNGAFTLYPNPAHDVLRIVPEFPTQGDARIIDLLGRKVWAGRIGASVRIDVSSWRPGIYYLIADGLTGRMIVKR